MKNRSIVFYSIVLISSIMVSCLPNDQDKPNKTPSLTTNTDTNGDESNLQAQDEQKKETKISFKVPQKITEEQKQYFTSLVNYAKAAPLNSNETYQSAQILTYHPHASDHNEKTFELGLYSYVDEENNLSLKMALNQDRNHPIFRNPKYKNSSKLFGLIEKCKESIGICPNPLSKNGPHMSLEKQMEIWKNAIWTNAEDNSMDSWVYTESNEGKYSLFARLDDQENMYNNIIMVEKAKLSVSISDDIDYTAIPQVIYFKNQFEKNILDSGQFKIKDMHAFKPIDKERYDYPYSEDEDIDEDWMLSFFKSDFSFNNNLDHSSTFYNDAGRYLRIKVRKKKDNKDNISRLDITLGKDHDKDLSSDFYYLKGGGSIKNRFRSYPGFKIDDDGTKKDVKLFAILRERKFDHKENRVALMDHFEYRGVFALHKDGDTITVFVPSVHSELAANEYYTHRDIENMIDINNKEIKGFVKLDKNKQVINKIHDILLFLDAHPKDIWNVFTESTLNLTRNTFFSFFKEGNPFIEFEIIPYTEDRKISSLRVISGESYENAENTQAKFQEANPDRITSMAKFSDLMAGGDKVSLYASIVNKKYKHVFATTGTKSNTKAVRLFVPKTYKESYTKEEINNLIPDNKSLIDFVELGKPKRYNGTINIETTKVNSIKGEKFISHFLGLDNYSMRNINKNKLRYLLLARNNNIESRKINYWYKVEFSETNPMQSPIKSLEVASSKVSTIFGDGINESIFYKWTGQKRNSEMVKTEIPEDIKFRKVDTLVHVLHAIQDKGYTRAPLKTLFTKEMNPDTQKYGYRPLYFTTWEVNTPFAWCYTPDKEWHTLDEIRDLIDENGAIKEDKIISDENRRMLSNLDF